jgi:hypothetical protein
VRHRRTASPLFAPGRRALLLRGALDAGVPPSMARLPMTPEEVAAVYEEAEAVPVRDDDSYLR